MRGFVSGVMLGGVVAVAGFVILSQTVLLPVQPPAPSATEPAPVAEDPPAAAPEAAAPDAAAPDAAAPEPAAEAPAPSPAAEPAPAPLPQVTAAPPAAPAAPEAPPAEGQAPVAADAPAAAPVPSPPEAGATADAAPDSAAPPPLPPLTPEEEAMLAPLPNEVPPGSPLAPEPALEEAAPAAEDPAPAQPEAPPEPLLDRPAPGLPDTVEGVTTGRLPVVGDSSPAAAPATAADADAPPVVRYAAPFENPVGKPMFTVVLIDDGRADLDRAALAALPLPVTIALDPTDPGAAEHAAAYRAAGKEVAMLASGLPQGAEASDVLVTFEAHARALPEAVAVVDLPEGGFQNDRPLAAAVVPVLKDQGRGLLTFDRGLNAADQTARREGVPAATVFRILDADDESVPVIRRYLDRAAFKAAQDGRVAVLGTASPETLAALLEWTVEGRAGSVALAPLTAVLSQPE